MLKKGVLYVKGLTAEEALWDLNEVKQHCLENNIELIEVLYDVTLYHERDLNCIDKLYDLLFNNKVDTIIFNSCYPFFSVRNFINDIGRLTDKEILNFENGIFDYRFSNAKRKDLIVINQSMFDRDLNVDFGNWVEELSKNRNKKVLYISREEDLRLQENHYRKLKNIERDNREKRKILGILFNEKNEILLKDELQRELFINKSISAELVYYDSNLALEEILRSDMYLKIITDFTDIDNIVEFRDFINTCYEYVSDVSLIFYDLSTKEHYGLLEILDVLTFND